MLVCLNWIYFLFLRTTAATAMMITITATAATIRYQLIEVGVVVGAVVGEAETVGLGVTEGGVVGEVAAFACAEGAGVAKSKEVDACELKYEFVPANVAVILYIPGTGGLKANEYCPFRSVVVVPIV